MELVKTAQVLKKNKVSTSLKTRGLLAGRFCYVADTPDLFSKSLDKTHVIYGAMHERNRTKHPLKFNLF